MGDSKWSLSPDSLALSSFYDTEMLMLDVRVTQKSSSADGCNDKLRYSHDPRFLPQVLAHKLTSS